MVTRAAIQTGVEKLAALRVFLLSNNKIAAWSEVERLGGLTALEELLLVGNPLYNEFKDKGDTQNYRIEVCLASSQDGGVRKLTTEEQSVHILQKFCCLACSCVHTAFTIQL